jgi:IclR family KDG regulon transcriptional repressor
MLSPKRDMVVRELFIKILLTIMRSDDIPNTDYRSIYGPYGRIVKNIPDHKKKEGAVIKNPGQNKRYQSSSPAVEQAVEILKYLASDRKLKAGLTDISNRVKIPKTKVFSILNALLIAGFVSKDEMNKVYSLGPDIISIGQRALDNVDYRDAAQPFLEMLAKETKCTALLGIVISNKFLIVSKQASGQEVDSRLTVGFAYDVFYQAHGKAIFAALPQREQKRLLSGNNFLSTYNGELIENFQLAKEIEEISERGFAMNDGRLNRMIKLLSVAVKGPKNYPIGALMVIGLMNKSVILKNGALLVAAAKDLSLALGASNPT